MNSQPDHARLDTLHFDNRFIQQLPADPVTENRCRQISGSCYSWVSLTPVTNPKLVAFSADMAATLGLYANNCLSVAREPNAYTQTPWKFIILVGCH